MSRFARASQKYGPNGEKIPKGREGLKTFRQLNPGALVFDSKSEYETYKKLKGWEREGKITNLQTQIKFELLPKNKWWNNVKEKWEAVRELYYVADFTFNRGDQKVIADCKGWTQRKEKKSGLEKWIVYYDEMYRVKKKILLQKYCSQGEYVFEEY